MFTVFAINGETADHAHKVLVLQTDNEATAYAVATNLRKVPAIFAWVQKD